MVDEITVLHNGIEDFKAGNVAAAISKLEEASRVFPESYEAFVYLGAAYSQQKRHNAAIGALKRASEIRPNSAKVHYNLGQAYEAANVPDEAWSEYSKSLTIDPEYQLAKVAMSSLSSRLPALHQGGIKMEDSNDL